MVSTDGMVMGEGAKQGSRIIRMSLMSSTASVLFIIFYMAQSLSIDLDRFLPMLRFAALCAVATEGWVLWKLSRWLQPLTFFIDAPPSPLVYQSDRDVWDASLSQAVMLPGRYVMLDVVSWLTATILIAIYGRLADLLYTGEIVFLVSTALLILIAVNLIRMPSLKAIITPVLRISTRLEPNNLQRAAISQKPVRDQVMFFVFALVVFLLLFFIQLLVISSLKSRVHILEQQGREVMEKVSDTLLTTPLTERIALSKTVSSLPLRGVSNLFITDRRGRVFAGNPDAESMKHLDHYLRTNTQSTRSLFMPRYLFMNSFQGAVIGVRCDVRQFSQGLFQVPLGYLVLILLAGLICLYIGRRIADDISFSLRELNSRMRQIARGEGGLGNQLRTYRSEEIAGLEKRFNLLSVNLNQVVRGIRNEVASLQSSLAQFRKEFQDQLQETKTLEASLHRLLTEMTDFINVGQLTRRQCSALTDHVRAAMNSSVQSVVLFRKEADILDVINESSQVNATVIEFMVQKSAAMKEIMDVVDSLSDQTRLLSLNALLESVGAGQGGTRFGVVAEEIRRLADTVASSTDSIRTGLKDMMVMLDSLVSMYDREQSVIETVIAKMANNQHFLEEIGKHTGSVVTALDQIQPRIGDQQEGVEAITGVVKTIAEGAKKSHDSIIACDGIFNQLHTTARRLHEHLVGSNNH